MSDAGIEADSWLGECDRTPLSSRRGVRDVVRVQRRVGRRERDNEHEGYDDHVMECTERVRI